MLLAALAGACFLGVGTLVGFRLLFLGLRGGGLPEILLGAGLCSLTVVTLPALALSLGLKLGSPELQHGLYAAGLVPVVGFAMCLYAFTARVFHPRSAWAWLAVAGAGVAASLGVVGTFVTRVAAWEQDRVVSAHWSLLIMGCFAAGLAWTGVEAALYRSKLRRRVALGMADPVVSNRFLLWAIGSLAAVAGILTTGASLALGIRVVSHPVPILGIALAGMSLSVCWALAFFPPRRYCEQLRQRARRCELERVPAL